jgi:hypothetical protein
MLAGVIFTLMALFHLVRIYMKWPVMIGNWSVPKWVSWVGLIVLVASRFSGLGSQRMMNAENEPARAQAHDIAGFTQKRNARSQPPWSPLLGRFKREAGTHHFALHGIIERDPCFF